MLPEDEEKALYVINNLARPARPWDMLKRVPLDVLERVEKVLLISIMINDHPFLAEGFNEYLKRKENEKHDNDVSQDLNTRRKRIRSASQDR